MAEQVEHVERVEEVGRVEEVAGAGAAGVGAAGAGAAGAGAAGAVRKLREYDLLRIRPHDARFEADSGGGCWILSFEARHHVRATPVTKSIIDAFDGTRTLDEVARTLTRGDPRLACTRDDLITFVDTILLPHGLVEGVPAPARARGTGHALLWCHLPVVHTDRLARIFDLGRHLFRRRTATLAILAIVISLVGSVRTLTVHGLGLTSMNSLLVIAASYASLLAHETGHVSAAYRYRIRAGQAGVGMYLFWPVFYVDLTNAWRLGKRERVVVDCGGMYFQLLFAVPFAVAGMLGGAPDLCVVALAIASLTATNLFPFLRLDGYWIICDALGLANLSVNAFGTVGRLILRRPVERPRRYVVGAVLYVTSTLVMTGMGLAMVARLLGRRDAVTSQLSDIVSDLRDGLWSQAMVEFNQVFILLIPGISLAVVLARGFYRAARSGRQEKA